MGGLIPNPHDDSVKDKLDKQFSNPKLRNLRNRIHIGHPPSEPSFFTDPAHPRHLARISHRLKVWPDPDTKSGEPPPTTTQLRARWQYLLQVSLTDPVIAGQGGGGATVADLVREALQVFVVTDDPQTAGPGAPKCTAITFDAVQAALAPPLEYQVNIVPDVNARPVGNYVAKITLICRQDIPPNSNRPDPGADNGEVPPAQPIFLTKPKHKTPPAKQSTKKKKAAKKVSKKKAKK
jgi:hypothetical protein